MLYKEIKSYRILKSKCELISCCYSEPVHFRLNNNIIMDYQIKSRKIEIILKKLIFILNNIRYMFDTIKRSIIVLKHILNSKTTLNPKTKTIKQNNKT